MQELFYRFFSSVFALLWKTSLLIYRTKLVDFALFYVMITEHESWQHWSYDDFLGRIITSLFLFLALYAMGWVTYTYVGKADGMLIWAYAYIPFISVCFRTKSYFKVVRDE